MLTLTYCSQYCRDSVSTLVCIILVPFTFLCNGSYSQSSTMYQWTTSGRACYVVYMMHREECDILNYISEKD